MTLTDFVIKITPRQYFNRLMSRSLAIHVFVFEGIIVQVVRDKYLAITTTK